MLIRNTSSLVPHLPGSQLVRRYSAVVLLSVLLVGSIITVANLRLGEIEDQLELQESLTNLGVTLQQTNDEFGHLTSHRASSETEHEITDAHDNARLALDKWSTAHTSAITAIKKIGSSDEELNELTRTLEAQYISINDAYQNILASNLENTTVDPDISEYLQATTLIASIQSQERSSKISFINNWVWTVIVLIVVTWILVTRYVIIPNTRLTDESEILAEIGREVTSFKSTTMEDDWSPVAALIKQLIPYDRLVVGLHDVNADQTRRLHIDGMVGDTPTGNYQSIFSESLVSLHSGALSEGLLLNQAGLEEIAKTVPEAQVRLDQGLRSLVTGPFRWEGELIGSLSIWSKNDNQYTEREFNTATRIANQITGAVAASKTRETDNTLVEIGQVLTSAGESNEIFDTFFDLVQKIVPFDRAVLASVDVDGGSLTDIYLKDPHNLGDPIGSRFPTTGAAAGTFLQNSTRGTALGESELREVAKSSEMEQARLDQGFRSMVSAPLVWDDRVIGTLSMRSLLPSAYGVKQRILTERIADQIAGTVAVILSLEREERSKQEAERLEEINKTRSHFLALVTHELKTPLTASVAFADRLAKNPGDSIPDRELTQIKVIQRNNRYLEKMIEELIQLSWLERGELELDIEEISVPTLIQDARNNAEPLITGRNQTLEIFDQTNNLPLSGDRLRILQVVQNLLTNASKYSDEGTPIELHASTTESFLVIEVHDRGAGVETNENPADLFEAFNRGSSTVSGGTTGMGLGLYLSREIIDAHNGEIGLTPRPGGGTLAQIKLPL